MSTYEVISLVLSGLGLASVVFLAVQILLTKKHTKEMHDEQRRIQTVNVIDLWCNAVDKETRIAEKVVEELTEDNCKKLYDYMPFQVSVNMQRNICQMCSLDKNNCNRCSESNGYILIEGTPLVELRGLVTNYLNRLEIVAIAWQQGIVDREIIELQFGFLHNPGTKSALKNYRTIAGGGNSYPALRELYDAIAKRKMVHPNQKDEL